MKDKNLQSKRITDEDNINGKYYQIRQKKHIIRLSVLYLIPLILLSIYFQFHYSRVISESQVQHLKSIAEYESKMLDLFLEERIVNLTNIIDDPKLQNPPSSSILESYLEKLKRDSDVFIDIGFFDSSGVQLAYIGPEPYLEKRNYREESWYKELKYGEERYIITDIYLGFRKNPHFTIGVKRHIENQLVVLRATLDPKKIYEYITSIEGSEDSYISIVNKDGYYQLVTPHVGTILETSSIIPTKHANWGVEEIEINEKSIIYAYSWLRNAGWAVIAQNKDEGYTFSGYQRSNLIFSTVIIFILFIIIVIRANKIVESEREKDIVKHQLVHASKLASVGELASGIAHEINNPLAIIASEAGLIKDLMNPEYSPDTKVEDFIPNIDNINEAVFRCRDITRKLLNFVRKNEIELQRRNIHSIIDEITGGFLEHNMAVSNIEIIKVYCSGLPSVITDSNQVKQVFLNILNNAVDAIKPPGTITISTSFDDKNIFIAFTDTGKGMSEDEIAHIFLPFYTTKREEKGTGLGLSISHGIIENLGGKIEVESTPGRGSTFTIILPNK